MAISISGSNAIWGLSGSDTNFDDVLAKLKQVESTQLNRLEAWKSDWKLRYDAFDKIIEQVGAAQNMLASLTNKNNFVTKNVVSSDANVITAVANASADDVQHTINVSQMASNAIWANTGHVFSSKTDLINTTGQTQAFSYRYAGKDYSVDVPANTTLDSFVSMINNSMDNPGIKVSVVQTGGGYVFQIAGKSTGADNDLVIYSCNLEGMDATGSASTWRTNEPLDMSSAVTDPTNYAYDLLMEDGNRFTVRIAGDKTNSDLASAINAKVGRNIASIDDSGNLTLTDVRAMYRRDADAQSTFSTPSTLLNLGSSPAQTTLSSAQTVTLQINDGVTRSTRTLNIAGGTSLKDVALQIAQASGATSVNMGLNSAGSWELKLANVESLSFSSTDTGIGVTSSEGQMGTEITGTGVTKNFSTAVTIDTAHLTEQLAGSNADPTKTFTYTFVKADGSTDSFSLAQDATYQDLLNELQNYGSLDGNKVTFSDQVTGFYLSGGGTGGGMDGVTVKTDAVTSIAGMTETDTLESPPDLEYDIALNDGTVTHLTFAGGTSMSDILTEMRNQGLDVTLVDEEGLGVDLDEGIPTSGNYYLQIADIRTVSGPAITGQVTASSNWSIQTAANAKFQIDNWPVMMESSSNSVSDALEGVVFSIQGTGAANISVSTDIASVEQSIQNFLDAVNSVLLTVRQFTSYDENKETTTNDPDKIGSSNYSTSQLTAEKGGLLQGNYGVQLFNSRFTNLLGSAPPGFTSRTDASDLLSGDTLANLANLGIKMDTTATSQTYGLLVVAPAASIASIQQMDEQNYENMINNNLSAVVDFFCASGTGASTSSDFRYGSHVSGITKGGTYDVSYTVDSAGNIEHVYVGGVEATRDTSQPGYYYSVSSGDARGLSFQIDNLSEGAHSGQIRIKEGLVQTVNTFLKNELKFTDVNVSTSSGVNTDAISIKSENGALMVLRDNYKTIMANIDTAISKEEQRIALWESRQKTYFANLETLLKNYNDQQTQLEAQINSLSSNKK
ncbi:MAG: flagellar filament capping protein FliD [Desulfovibrio sp.]|nr:flagellar filament capping protein FliD [Desulfovibrio sp.]